MNICMFCTKLKFKRLFYYRFKNMIIIKTFLKILINFNRIINRFELRIYSKYIFVYFYVCVCFCLFIRLVAKFLILY